MLDVMIFVLHHLFLLVLYLFLFYILFKMFQLLKYQVSQGGNISFQKPLLSSLPVSQARLVSLDKHYHRTPKMYPVGDFLSIGRAAGNDIMIADSKVSRQHASIYNRDGQYWVEDLNSKNGAFLNDKKINGPVVMADGDKLRIGHAVFVFVRWGHEMGQNNAHR